MSSSSQLDDESNNLESEIETNTTNTTNGDDSASKVLQLAEDNNIDTKHTKIEKLRECLDSKRIITSDLKWTLFVSAVESDKWFRLLNPCPPKFIDERYHLDIERLLNTVATVLPLRVVRNQLGHADSADCDEISNETVDLLYWTLVTMELPKFRRIFESEFPEIISYVKGDNDCPKPDYIFEIQNQSSKDEYFKVMVAQSDIPTTYAYYGAKLEDFHNLTHWGLLRRDKFHQSGDNWFKGVTLTNALWSARKFSPYCCTWGGSELGQALSCVAICEFINNPEHVLTTVYPYFSDKSSFMNPHRYCTQYIEHYVLNDFRTLRMRYLMIYQNHERVKHGGNRWMDLLTRYPVRLALLFFVQAMLVYYFFDGFKYFNSAFLDYIHLVIQRIYM